MKPQLNLMGRRGAAQDCHCPWLSKTAALPPPQPLSRGVRVLFWQALLSLVQVPKWG